MRKEFATESLPAFCRIETAERLSGLSRSRIYKLLAEGRIEARKDGGSTLVRFESVVNYLNSLPPAQIGSAGRADAAKGTRIQADPAGGERPVLVAE